MSGRDFDKLLRLGLIIAIFLMIIAGVIYGVLNLFTPSSAPELPRPVLTTPTPTLTPTIPLATATLADLATPRLLPSSTPLPTSTQPFTTPIPILPPGGIVYALTPNINSVGWVQSGERGNHFGESYLYAGLHDGVLYHGAMQFDLSFIPNDSTIFLAELELTGLTSTEFVKNSAFTVNILTEDSASYPGGDTNWSRRNFEAIHNATVDETLSPALEDAELGPDRVNKFVFNAAQRSIIEERLASNVISLRVDSLTPEQANWFGWDSGYGEQAHGQGPILRVGVLPPAVTGTPENLMTDLNTPTLVVITSTPTPGNLQTAAAIAPKLTLEATTVGTPSPFPPNWVTPIVVTITPTPENVATARFQQAEATAAVIAFGTSTSTPVNMLIATPTPTGTATPIFVLLIGELPPITPTTIPTLIPQFIQPQLIGKIVFKSDRTGQEEYYVINPDGSGLGLLTNCWAYALAEQADAYSADGRFRVFTKDIVRFLRIVGEDSDHIQDIPQQFPAVFWSDALYKQEGQLSNFGAGIAYGGVWSPTHEQIAFISSESQNDEIWVINRDGSGLLQLTQNGNAIWDKHPSWSPDGKQLVFWSNRTGYGQIYLMNADGSNLYSLSKTDFNDYDPVWIKYSGIPSFNPDSEDGKPNYIGSLGSCAWAIELNCSIFDTQKEAQVVYNAAGGPLLDPYGLDLDRNSVACDSLIEMSPYNSTTGGWNGP